MVNCGACHFASKSADSRCNLEASRFVTMKRPERAYGANFVQTPQLVFAGTNESARSAFSVKESESALPHGVLAASARKVPLNAFGLKWAGESAAIPSQRRRRARIRLRPFVSVHWPSASSISKSRGGVKGRRGVMGRTPLSTTCLFRSPSAC